MALPSSSERRAESSLVPRASGGVAEEIRSLVETATPSSLSRALELIRDQGLGSSEFGRVMNAVAITLLQKLYGDIKNQFPAIDPPQTHSYTRIIREAERGVYTAAPASSHDYLEHVLPFLALLRETRPDRLGLALPDLRRAQELRQDSVLAPYFTGLVLERSGQGAEGGAMEDAAAAYLHAYTISDECYPAALGLARVMDALGQNREALDFLEAFYLRYPGIRPIKRQLALARYNNQCWAEAEELIAELLQRDSRNGPLLLMQARALVEQGLFIPAQAPLDLYGTLDSQNRQYLFLQARIQAEGYRNSDAALSFLRTILHASPLDQEASVYAVRLLLESGRTDDQDEGREILSRLLKTEAPSIAVVNLALQDAIRREAWEEARPYLAQVLRENRGPQELLSAYMVEQGLGNRRAALARARELYELAPSNVEGAVAYITALIDGGQREEAGRMLERGLAILPGGTIKSRYLYLRSRLHTNEEQSINDLRSSLFEDPRNLHTLIALFEIYRGHKNEQRAVFYLKQALALAPDNPQITRYKAEYANLLGN